MNPPLPEELLSAYADGECTPDEVRAVEARLADDPQWRTILEEIRETRAQLRGLPMREAPAGFVDGLLDLDGPDNVVELKRKRPGRPGAWLGAAAAVFAGVLVAVPHESAPNVTPEVATLAETHAATVSLGSDPLTALAPVVAPARFTP